MEYFAILRLVTTYVRAPATSSMDAQGNFVATFSPALTTAEQATFDRIIRLSKSLVQGITPAEWEAIEPSIAIGVQVLAAPPGTVMTAAQNLASHQAIWKVLKALIKN